MSTILATLLSKIKSVHDINEALKTAEKAKIFGLKQKAKQIFNVRCKFIVNLLVNLTTRLHESIGLLR